MSLAKNQSTIVTVHAERPGITAKTGTERIYTAQATVKGQNAAARAKKAVDKMLANLPDVWMFTGPATYTRL